MSERESLFSFLRRKAQARRDPWDDVAHMTVASGGYGTPHTIHIILKDGRRGSGYGPGFLEARDAAIASAKTFPMKRGNG